MLFLFSECGAATNITLGNDTTEETFSMSTSSAQLVVKSELDYETEKAYYFLMKVIDQGAVPVLTGYIAIRVRLNSFLFPFSNLVKKRNE